MFVAPVIVIAIVILLLWTRECLSSSDSNDATEPADQQDDLIKAIGQYLKED